MLDDLKLLSKGWIDRPDCHRPQLGNDRARRGRRLFALRSAARPRHPPAGRPFHAGRRQLAHSREPATHGVVPHSSTCWIPSAGSTISMSCSAATCCSISTTRRKLRCWKRSPRVLQPDGVLMLGHAESPDAAANSFSSVEHAPNLYTHAQVGRSKTRRGRLITTYRRMSAACPGRAAAANDSRA